MLNVCSEAETNFRRWRISLGLRLCSLRKVCSSLIASAGPTESAFKKATVGKQFSPKVSRLDISSLGELTLGAFSDQSRGWAMNYLAAAGQ
jgi:hypothetical protein